MSAQLDTPEWRSAEHSFYAEDPLGAARFEAWQRTSKDLPQKPIDTSSSITDNFTKPIALLGETLTGAGLAGRLMFKMPFAESMSWGVTALGKALTEYSIAKDKEQKSEPA